MSVSVVVVADSADSASPIPGLVHQTGPAKILHPRHFEAVRTFRQLNSEMSHYFFDDEQLDDYMAENWSKTDIYSVFQRSLVPQMRADIFRYCVVFDRGGYYLDINKTITRPLKELQDPSAHALISFERNDATIFPDPDVAEHLAHPGKAVLQWAFGFAPQHPILELAIRRIERAAHHFEAQVSSVRDAVVMFTGPGVFTAALRDHVQHRGPHGISQAGIDFSGSGVFRVEGSNLTPESRTHYTQMPSQYILGPPFDRADFSE